MVGCAKTTAGVLVASLAAAVIAAYSVYPWLCRRNVDESEASAPLPGDDIVQDSVSGYTLAVNISAPPSRVWSWLVQMGQGRAGFYTHEWLENLIGADIHNADRIVSHLQQLVIGEQIRLTPDPYKGQPGQFITVASIDPPRALVLRQQLPSGGTGSWAYVLRPAGNESTRLLFRRRGSRPSLFDRIMAPGYCYMDMGMLAGIKERAETRWAVTPNYLLQRTVRCTARR